MHFSVLKRQKDLIKQYMRYACVMSFIVSGMLFMSAEPAMAQMSPMGNVICMIIGIIYGNLGRGLSVLAVIVVGIGATLGKVSWGLAMTVAVGVGTVFGAVPLVAYLVSGNGGTQICFGVGGVQ